MSIFHCPTSVMILLSEDLLYCGFPASQSLLQVVKRLPLVKVTWREPRLMPVQRREEQAEGSLAEGAEPQQWQLEVRLQRAGGGRAGTSAARVYAPRFPKACLASCRYVYISSITSRSCRGGRVATHLALLAPSSQGSFRGGRVATPLSQGRSDVMPLLCAVPLLLPTTA